MDKKNSYTAMDDKVPTRSGGDAQTRDADPPENQGGGSGGGYYDSDRNSADPPDNQGNEEPNSSE